MAVVGQMLSDSGRCPTDGSNLPAYTAALTDESAVVQRKGSSESARLRALLRATKIKESVLLEGIQRLGGGQKGLRGLVKVILYWLAAKNRHNIQSSERCDSQPDILEPWVGGIDNLARSNLDFECVWNGHAGHSGNLNRSILNASHSDLNSLLNLAPLCRINDDNLCDLNVSFEEHSRLPKLESRSSIFLDEHGSLGGLSDGLTSEGSILTREDISSTDCLPPMYDYIERHERSHHTKMIMNVSSPDQSAVDCTSEFIPYGDTLNEQSNIRRRSPTHVGYTSSQSSGDFSAYLNTATVPMPEVLGASASFDAAGENPFEPGGPFDASPSSPPSLDLQSLDFNSFSKQGCMIFGENLGLGISPRGCGPIDRIGSSGYSWSPQNCAGAEHSVSEHTGSQLRVIANSKSNPAGLTRLLRKQRMKRIRKASFQDNRVAFAANVVLMGESSGLHSSGSLRSNCRSQAISKPGRPASRTIDRKDLKDLQFLLLKVLRPSDVGNLGRIVLHKKDAESCLPWLAAREGMQFPCEDYDTGEMMMLRYRFWPNNKSRMYLLENTGDFTRRHLLRESDKMLIYRNKVSGTYVMQARKAQDCVDDVLSLDQKEDTEGRCKETSKQNSPVGSCSSGASLLSETETVGSGHDGASESSVPVSAIITPQDELLDFASLPAAPMGEGTQGLMRFPSLESLDVESLGLLDPVAIKQEDGFSCGLNLKVEYG